MKFAVSVLIGRIQKSFTVLFFVMFFAFSLYIYILSSVRNSLEPIYFQLQTSTIYMLTFHP